MRVVVLSDTHGNYKAVESVIMRNTDADWIIHLGDGERELDQFVLSHPVIAPKIIHVAGNCDFNTFSSDTFILQVMNHRILATHGHLFGIKSSLGRLKLLAKENGCDIVLYGHSHISYQNYEDDLYILNPGSASYPRDGKAPTFGHIDISDLGVVLNVAEV